MIPGSWKAQALSNRTLQPGRRYAVAIVGPAGWQLEDAARWLGSYLNLDFIGPGAAAGPGFTTFEASGVNESATGNITVTMNDGGGVQVVALYVDTGWPPTVTSSTPVRPDATGLLLVSGDFYRITLITDGTVSALQLQQALLGAGFGFVRQPPNGWPSDGKPLAADQQWMYVEGPFLGPTMRLAANARLGGVTVSPFQAWTLQLAMPFTPLPEPPPPPPPAGSPSASSGPPSVPSRLGPLLAFAAFAAIAMLSYQQIQRRMHRIRYA